MKVDGVDRRVAGGRDVGDAGGGRGADRLADAAVGAGADRRRRRRGSCSRRWTSLFGSPSVARAGQVVDGADEVRPLAVARVVEDLDRHERARRGDADDADAVVAFARRRCRRRASRGHARPRGGPRDSSSFRARCPGSGPGPDGSRSMPVSRIGDPDPGAGEARAPGHRAASGCLARIRFTPGVRVSAVIETFRSWTTVRTFGLRARAPAAASEPRNEKPLRACRKMWRALPPCA